MGWEDKLSVAKKNGLKCDCWECARSRGITPAANSDVRFRKLTYGTKIYRVDNGQVEGNSMSAGRQSEVDQDIINAVYGNK